MATKHKTLKTFQAGRGYSRADWDEVSDNPPIAKDEAAGMTPFREAFPDLAKAMDDEVAKRGRPPKEFVKQPVTIRLNPDTIKKFKATGKGWQSRISDILDAAKL
jgi:uncharacterized protein (DUF4415 family)